MKNLKMLFCIVVFSVIGFLGCDDSASSNEPDENASVDSSSSVCKDCDDESSSSAKKIESSAEKNVESSDDAETGKSSSSKGNGTSSSSVKTSDSSSSKKDVSSSSVNSSSSVKSSSSSSVKQSSSSVASSSSEYIPYNHAGPLLADSLNSNAYQKFLDSRNGRSYYYLTINGKDGASVTVMAENLNIGEMVNGDKDQTNDSKIERYCYDNDTTKCDKYGGLYQWAEMMNLPFECNSKSCADSIKPNHQGICPDGWRLLTYDDLVVILKADGNEDGIKGARAQGFGGYNTTGYSLVGAGYNWNYGFKNIGEAVYWFYPEEDADSPATKASDSFTGQSLNSFAKYSTKKINGFSVRCVKSK